MGLGRKIAILQITLIAIFICATLIMGHLVWGQNYLKLEQDQVKDNTNRALLAWEEELEILGSLTGDWAPWDDLFAFAKNTEEIEFVEKNLPNGAMVNLKINGAIVLDPEGKALFAKAVNLEDKSETEVPASLLIGLSRLVMSEAFQIEEDQSLKSFILVDNQPALFSIQRILTSDKKGPSPGLLVFVKFADEALMQEISRRTQVQVAFFNPNTPDPSVVSGKEYQEITEDAITAYKPLVNAYGEEGCWLASTTLRSIYKQGQVQMRSFLLATIMFGLLLMTATLVFLNRSVLSRIRKMGVFMNDVISRKDYSSRVTLTGNDELAQASQVMNEMLSQIEKSQEEISGLLASLQLELEERKKAEQNLIFLSSHDPLTGLYNRTYYEQTISNLAAKKPRGVGIICCDFDGLKFINDTMGHSTGDLVLRVLAESLKEGVSEEAVVARIGGDEFAVILSDVDEDYVKQTRQRMFSQLKSANFGGLGLKISVSAGWSYSSSELDESGIRALIRQADDYMYREKLSSSSSNRNALVQGMLEMLKVRDFITEGHSQRLQQRLVDMGRVLGLNEPQIADLNLLAQFHDIGKVGIADTLLFKPGKLTEDEKKEMERHSEIGHRIAQAIPELAPISDYILKHHEWWNGSGYPLGLKGEEIPIEDRILSIADAFDAMTNNRPYRAAMATEEAIAELRRFKSIQFDPELVEIFIGLVENE